VTLQSLSADFFANKTYWSSSGLKIFGTTLPEQSSVAFPEWRGQQRRLPVGPLVERSKRKNLNKYPDEFNVRAGNKSQDFEFQFHYLLWVKTYPKSRGDGGLKILGFRPAQLLHRRHFGFQKSLMLFHKKAQVFLGTASTHCRLVMEFGLGLRPVPALPKLLDSKNLGLKLRDTCLASTAAAYSWPKLRSVMATSSRMMLKSRARSVN